MRIALISEHALSLASALAGVVDAPVTTLCRPGLVGREHRRDTDRLRPDCVRHERMAIKRHPVRRAGARRARAHLTCGHVAQRLSREHGRVQLKPAPTALACRAAQAHLLSLDARRSGAGALQ